MANSLSCATHVKSLSRHKVLRKKAAADAAPLPFSSALAAAEFRNMHVSGLRYHDHTKYVDFTLVFHALQVYNKSAKR